MPEPGTAEPGTAEPGTVEPETAAPEGSEAPASREPWIDRRRLDLTGLVVALVAGCLAFTPSLLPRSWLIQGAVAGVSAAAGYGIGVLLAWVVRGLLGRERGQGTPRVARWVLGVAAVVGIVGAAFLGAQWQRDLYLLMDLDPPARTGYSLSVLLGVLIALGLLYLARGIRWVTRWLVRTLGRVLPPRAAQALGVVVAVVLLVSLVNGVLVSNLYSALDASFQALNAETEATSEPPTAAEKSGSPDSLVSWDSLGRNGRRFISDGPSAAEISAFTGEPAVEPVRAYVGLDAADTAAARAQLAVDELDRAGGFDREVLLVVTPTGTGWIEEMGLTALETMYGGDTAIVSMQYSYLPSWLSFLVDRPRAGESGRALFDAVYGTWSDLPLDRRPALLVFGESLGSFGGEAAFTGVNDLSNRTSGALFVGPPSSNTLWGQIVEGREPGSPQWQPVYDDGRTVRFASDITDVANPPGTWDVPRVLYLQHASDPITWWSPELLFSRPDWLGEPRGPDVLAATRWFPVVTFLQVSADMANSTGVPDGHGHSYGYQQAQGWTQVAPPPGWTDADTERLIDSLR